MAISAPASLSQRWPTSKMTRRLQRIRPWWKARQWLYSSITNSLPPGTAWSSLRKSLMPSKRWRVVATADSVEFRSAPLYIRDALTFPYRYGLDFEVQLLTKAGKDPAFAGAFRNPPKTTREIMQPDTYLAGER